MIRRNPPIARSACSRVAETLEFKNFPCMFVPFLGGAGPRNLNELKNGCS